MTQEVSENGNGFNCRTWTCFRFCMLLLVIFLCKSQGYESGQKRAGRQGENYVCDLICQVLKEKDLLFSNVSIEIEGKRTELDHIIVNNRGIFIIEVKNYSGSLMGTDNDYEWVKTKISSSGNSYTKIVKNPIKQVNRQVYLLAQFLKYYGVDVWVEGYTFFVQGNSPVDCKQVLESAQDINHVIHNGANRNLTNAKVQEIQKLLS